jgi:hypothetical protein
VPRGIREELVARPSRALVREGVEGVLLRRGRVFQVSPDRPPVPTRVHDVREDEFEAEIPPQERPVELVLRVKDEGINGGDTVREIP